MSLRPMTALPRSAMKQCNPPDIQNGEVQTPVSRPKSHLSITYELDDPNRTPRFYPLKKLPLEKQTSVEIQTEAYPPRVITPKPARAFDQGTQMEEGDPPSRCQTPNTSNTFYQRLLSGRGQRKDSATLRLDTAATNETTATSLMGGPMFRQGRGGSCWRHLSRCTGVMGNNIMFVDGCIKEDDCRMFPPHGLPGSVVVYTNIASCLQSRQRREPGMPFPQEIPSSYAYMPALTVTRRPPSQQQQHIYGGGVSGSGGGGIYSAAAYNPYQPKRQLQTREAFESWVEQKQRPFTVKRLNY